mgnify:CR=1 FL=1
MLNLSVFNGKSDVSAIRFVFVASARFGGMHDASAVSFDGTSLPVFRLRASC